MSKLLWGSMGVTILLGVGVLMLRHNTIALVLLVLLIVLFQAFIISSLSRASNYMRRHMDQILSGQLNMNMKKTRFDIVNKVGEKINSYTGKVRGLIGDYVSVTERIQKGAYDMKNQTEQLKLSASEIASTVQGIAESANSQAEETANVKEQIEDFALNVTDIKKNASSSISVAAETQKIVKDSFNAFREVVSKIEGLKEYNQKVLHDISNLDKAANEINIITEAVDDISSQTHLLALNASIEAARAGEAGRGFAVVAGEVGKLADQSSNSAKQIKELLGNIISEVKNLQQSMKAQSDIVAQNVAYAVQSLNKSDQIDAALKDNMSSVQVITRLVEDQMKSIEHIVASIEAINDATQQNAAVTEEITASTQEQLSIIESMNNNVLELVDSVDNSNKMVEEFMHGFKITDSIKEKIEKTKGVIRNIAVSSEICSMDEQKIREFVKKVQKENNYIELIAVLDSKGYVTGATLDVPKHLRNCSSRQYYSHAIKGETYVSKEYISTVTGHYNITVSSPVKFEGKTIGVLVCDIDINE